MAPKSFHLLLLAILSTMAVSSLAVRAMGLWKPIDKLDDSKLEEMAEFALQEHFKADAHFESITLIKAEQQVVKGINYRLVFSATDGAGKGTYTAVVYQPLGGKPLELTSFEKN